MLSGRVDWWASSYVRPPIKVLDWCANVAFPAPQYFQLTMVTTAVQSSATSGFL